MCAIIAGILCRAMSIQIGAADCSGKRLQPKHGQLMVLALSPRLSNKVHELWARYMLLTHCCRRKYWKQILCCIRCAIVMPCVRCTLEKPLPVHATLTVRPFALMKNSDAIIFATKLICLHWLTHIFNRKALVPFCAHIAPCAEHFSARMHRQHTPNSFEPHL